MQKGSDSADNPEPITLPIEDVLDLHTFLPKEIPSLLSEYLRACRETGIYSVRIIHGKGKGQLKHRVQGLLEKHPMVASFSDAPSRAGGWGATIVELRRAIDFSSPEWARLLDKGAKAMNIRLEPAHVDRFAVHAKELVAWNRSVNLTAITDPVEVAVKHFLDILPVSLLLPQESQVLDIGSGGGFPGIPLKVMRPDLHVMLIDATRKKVSFQKHIINTLALEDIEARHVRAEDLEREFQPEPRRYNAVVSKAVATLDNLFDLAVPLVRRPGIIIAMKGKSVEAELKAVRPKIRANDLSVVTKKYRLPYLGIERSLIILSDIPDLTG